jgi:hypothetical protein
MVTTFWILSTCQKLPHTTMNIPTMFHEVWWKKWKKNLNPPFLDKFCRSCHGNRKGGI